MKNTCMIEIVEKLRNVNVDKILSDDTHRMVIASVVRKRKK